MGRANSAQHQSRLLLATKAARHFFFPHRDPASKRTLLIAGVQRSGTNMMAEIFERALVTDVFRESDPRAYRNFELRDYEHILSLVNGSRAGFLVFKVLCELQDLKTMLERLPNARAIWMLRRVEDMVNSHVRAAFRTSAAKSCNERMNNILIDPLSEGWRGRGLSDETKDILARYLRPDIDHQSAVALFWFMRNRLYFELGLADDPRVTTVIYERFVSAPRDYGLALLNWAGVPNGPGTLAKVNPASIGRHARPEIEPAILDLCHDLYAKFERDAAQLPAKTG